MELNVPSSDGYIIECRLWKSTSTLSTCIFIHGGAFANGDCKSGSLISKFLTNCQTNVITCSFRNGPSYPHSSGKAILDLLSVSKYICTMYPNLPFGIVGSSSGGYFALALAQRLAEITFPVQYCIPICPVAHPGRRSQYLQSCMNDTAETDGYTFYHSSTVAALIHQTQLSFWQDEQQAQEAGEALRVPLTIPTLCIVGAQDTNVPAQVTMYVQQWATKTISIGNAGHEICTTPSMGYKEDVQRFIEIAINNYNTTKHNSKATHSTATSKSLPTSRPTSLPKSLPKSLPTSALPTGYKLRAATLADVISLKQLEQGVIEAERPYDATIHSTNAKYYNIEQLISNDKSYLLVVEEINSTAVLASGYVQVRKSKEYKTHLHHGYLGFMWVDIKLRGNGVNQVVVKALMEWAKTKYKVTHFYLDVYHLNVSAVRAYQKVGFVPLLSNMSMSIKNVKKKEENDDCVKMATPVPLPLNPPETKTDSTTLTNPTTSTTSTTSTSTTFKPTSNPTSSLSFHDTHLKSPIKLLQFPSIQHFKPNLSQLLSLDLSTNEISELPGLKSLKALTSLNISRNWFNQIPIEIVHLKDLTVLNIRRNFLKPNDVSLQIPALASLLKLSHLDLQWNKKLKRPDWYQQLQQKLPHIEHIQVTVNTVCTFKDGTWTSNAPPGSYVGMSPAARDATQLRAQLEPHGTLILRRRLVETFHQEPTNSDQVLRAEVMKRLLNEYYQINMMDENGRGTRPIVKIDGIEITNQKLLNDLLFELKKWQTKQKFKGNAQERPSIAATNYMILRSPLEFETKLLPESKTGKRGSRKALLAKQKYEKYVTLWKLAQKAMHEIDPEFSEKFTALAVTHNFVGSPHIDKQNITPFYGLALGSFKNGEGGLRVEYDAKTVVEMNTKNRLGRIDGRYPHWVAPWNNENGTLNRYSLIYYQTEGVTCEKGAAVPGVVIH